MRWGIPTRPQCILCLKNEEVLRTARYDAFGLELCEPHEDMVKAREKEKEQGEGSGGGKI